MGNGNVLHPLHVDDVVDMAVAVDVVLSGLALELVDTHGWLLVGHFDWENGDGKRIAVTV
jgi:hypothetical protein